MYIFLSRVTFFVIFSIIMSACGGSNNTTDMPATQKVGVLAEVPKNNSTLYEDAEDGTTSKWIVKGGFEITNEAIGANGSARSIFVKENWFEEADGNFTNNAHYEMALYNDSQFILHFDKMKKVAQIQYCFTVGATVTTQQGERYISFNTFYDKGKSNPSSQVLANGITEMVFPLSMEYVTEGGVWKHLRLDLQKNLNYFEPNNKIIAVSAFYFQGGDDYLDNIRLASE